MDTGTVLNAVTLALVAGLGALWRTSREALEAGVKASAEEGAKTAVKNVNWPRELAQELEKARGTERQELRLQSYGALWAELRALAIYDPAPLDSARSGVLEGKLTAWYFSPVGGLLLTPQVRDFYFALQDVLQALGHGPAWSAERHGGALHAAFAALLAAHGLDRAAAALEFLDEADSARWFAEGPEMARAWREDTRRLPELWPRLSGEERFTALQQLGSALRTALTKDVDSRSR